jgi:protein-serine/threonine kinase
VAGTTHAMAPEMIRHMVDGGAANGYSYGIDWWALGILTYELIVGTPPFGLFGEDIIHNIVAGVQGVDMKDVEGPARDLVLRLLCADENNRLGSRGFEEVVDHAFMEVRSIIKPTQSLLNGIISWSDFLEDTEEITGPDPFKDF